MTSEISLAKGEGRTKICLLARKIGRDLIITITGGREHAGAIGIGLFINDKATSSVITLPNHKEDAIAKQAAEEIAKELRTNAVVIAGVHLDNITREEIDEVIENSKMLVAEFIAEFKKREGGV